MQMGQTRHGMQTLNQCLAKMVISKQITKEDALQRAYDPEELIQMLTNAATSAQPQQRRR